MRRRRRTLPFSLGSGRLKSNQYLFAGCPGPEPPDADIRSNLGVIYGSQVTDSEDHQWPPPPGEVNDVGGNFFTQKKYVKGGIPYINAASFGVVASPCIGRDVTYAGPMWPVPPSYMQFPAAKIASDAELNKLGATAVAKCKPTNAVINLATFLSEMLREGTPRLPFKEWKVGTGQALKAKQLPDKASDEYLNWQFGWKPVIGDIEAVTNQIANAEQVIAQYERDAGRVVRRRWDLPDKQSYDVSTIFETASGYYAPIHTDLVRPGRSYNYRIENVSTTKTWFSGAFTYHLPADWKGRKEMNSASARLSDLFDLGLTPESVWNATPWTWAVDWFANTGDVLSNISSWAKDGLVMRYGYVMQHNVEERIYTLVEQRPLKGMTSPADIKLSLITETKVRRQANPYGFGISWDGLSATQQAILAALGITRTSR